MIFHGKSIVSRILTPFSQCDFTVWYSVSVISFFSVRISDRMPILPMSCSSDATTISSTISFDSFISSATARAYSIVMCEFPLKNGSLISSRPTRTSIVSMRHFFRCSSVTGTATGALSSPAASRRSRSSRWSRMKSEDPNRRTSSEVRMMVKDERTITRDFGDSRRRRRLSSTPELSGRNCSHRTKSGGELETILIASAPVAARDTRRPASVRRFAIMSRTPASLLMIRTDFCIIPYFPFSL